MLIVEERMGKRDEKEAFFVGIWEATKLNLYSQNQNLASSLGNSQGPSWGWLVVPVAARPPKIVPAFCLIIVADPSTSKKADDRLLMRVEGAQQMARKLCWWDECWLLTAYTKCICLWQENWPPQQFMYEENIWTNPTEKHCLILLCSNQNHLTLTRPCMPKIQQAVKFLDISPL